MTYPFNIALTESRQQHGMTTAELARKAGFTPSFVSQYEDCAVNPTVRTLFKFAGALGWTVTVNKLGVRIEDEDGSVLLDQWDPEHVEEA